MESCKWQSTGGTAYRKSAQARLESCGVRGQGLCLAWRAKEPGIVSPLQWESLKNIPEEDFSSRLTAFRSSWETKWG